jgi:muramidase (phage lysozyme)
MNRGAAIGALVLAAAVIYWRKTLQSLTINPNDALKNPNVQAILATVRRFESNGDYSVLYGGGHFSDFSKHPNIRVPFVNKNKALHADGSPNDYSTAAGAYQINHPTYLLWSAVPGAPTDFGYAAQDYLAVVGLQLIGALQDVIDGNFFDALATMSGTWASLPGSKAQQNPQSLQLVQNTYVDNGGSIVA